MTINSAISGGGALIQNSGSLNLNAQNSYTGGTTVNGGALTLAPDGPTGTIQGNLTINSGATVNANANAWSLGYLNSGGNTCVSAIGINGGTLFFFNSGSAGNNGGTSASSITMTGGTIASDNYNFGWYNGITNNPTLTTNASTATAVIASGINMRLTTTGYVTFNVAQGTVPNGVDLLVSGPISNGGGGNFVKSGLGLLSFTGANSYSGSTTINGGILQASNTGRCPTTARPATSRSTRAARSS